MPENIPSSAYFFDQQQSCFEPPSRHVYIISLIGQSRGLRSNDLDISTCENDPPEGTVLYEVTNSVRRFCQRKGLSYDRFDRTGLK